MITMYTDKKCMNESRMNFFFIGIKKKTVRNDSVHCLRGNTCSAKGTYYPRITNPWGQFLGVCVGGGGRSLVL